MDRADAAPDEVDRARTRARQRLIGAVILVAAGIIGFPLVFETQPRPIAVDVPIEIPSKDAVPPLPMPPASKREAASATVADAPTPGEDIITESAAESGRDATPPGGPPKAEPAPATAPPAKPLPNNAQPPAASSSAADARVASDGARAKALLEGKTESNPNAGRFIVQVGAFAESAAAQEARTKVERLGLKTYTQVAETPNGSRIRVRLGPYASRDDADKALAKARAAGLGGVVLGL